MDAAHSSRKILIVEDEQVIAYDLQQRLLSMGYAVADILGEAEEAVEYAGANRPDLILMDIVLRGRMDGIEAARIINSRFGIPVLYISAYADDQILERAKKTESLGHLIKPFDDRELKFAVEMALYKAASDRELRDTKERLRALLETTNTIPWEFDLRIGRYTYVGPQSERILGYPASEWTDISSWRARIHPEDAKAAWETARRAVKAAADYENEYRIRVGGGEVRWFRDVVTVFSDATGPCILRGFMLDITLGKRAEETLAESERRFRAIFHNAGDGIALCETENLRIAMANPSFCAMLGYDPVDVVRMSLHDTHPKDAVQEMISHFISHGRGQECFVRDVPVKRRDDSVLYADVTTTPLVIDGKGYLLGFFRDVTKRRRVEEELRESRERAEAVTEDKDRFLASASRELRAPLNSIAELAKEIALGETDPGRAEHLRLIGSWAASLIEIVDELREYSVIESEGAGLVREEFNLREALKEIERTFGQAAARKEIDFAFEVDPGLPDRLFGDARGLHRIMGNLVGHAIENTDAGAVYVRAMAGPIDRGGIEVNFSITDTGKGTDTDKDVPGDEAADIYIRSDAEGAEDRWGGGLRLAIASRLIDLMDGGMHITNTLGKGSTFSFALRFDLWEDRLHKYATSGDFPRSPLRVCLIEENFMDRTAGLRILQKAGHVVTAHEFGEDAVELLGSWPIDVVLIGMNSIDDRTAASVRRIRDVLGASSIDAKVLATVSPDILDVEGVCPRAGVDGYIMKPVKSSELVSFIENAVSGTRT